jgi:hypothetical protein
LWGVIRTAGKAVEKSHDDAATSQDTTSKAAPEKEKSDIVGVGRESGKRKSSTSLYGRYYETNQIFSLSLEFSPSSVTVSVGYLGHTYTGRNIKFSVEDKGVATGNRL